MAKSPKFKGKRPKKGLAIEFTPSHVEFFHTAAAEREPELESYYVSNRYSELASQFESKKTFFIGRTGMGKSALLELVKQKVDKNSLITINPEDFAFTIMERSPILEALTANGINLDLFYKTMWKYILITGVLKKRFGAEKKTWLEQQFTGLGHGIAKRAYKYLLDHDELDGGLSFPEQVSSIVKRMEHSIEIGLEKSGLKFTYGAKLTPDDKSAIQTTLQKFEFSQLTYFIRALDEDVLRNHKLTILIDDLDKNWIQNAIGINFTRCLFETIFELNEAKKIRLLVALRTNLFHQLNFHQREKLLPYIEHMSWTNEQLRKIVESRFRSLFPIDGPDVWRHIFPESIKVDSGKEFSAFDYMLKRSNRRPRDLMVFIGYMIQRSLGENSISLDAVRDAERLYSQDRLVALFEEWRNPFLKLGFLQEYFSGVRHKMSRKDFFEILDTITIDLLSNEKSEGLGDLGWIVEGQYINRETFGNENLFRLLYRIGFVGWKPFGDSQVQFSFLPGCEEATDKITDKARFYVNSTYYSALHAQFQ